MKEEQFPKWKYHKDNIEGKIFHNREDFKKAGKGWVDSPVDIDNELDDKEPEDEFLGLEDLKVAELKEILINSYGLSHDEVKSLRKDDLILKVVELKEAGEA